MIAALERGTTIGRLRVRAAARDAAAVRMRSEALLRDADLQPSSLPPHAILCIRSFADPLPGALDLDSRKAPSARWHEAARSSLDATALRAVRPAREAVPAAAEAVVFMDRAELLACAARDALRGALALGWWWRHLFDVHDGIAAVARELARQPRYVPAVIEQLVQRRDEIVAFARAIAQSESIRIVEAVLRENELHELAYAIVTALTTPRAALFASTPLPTPTTTRSRAESPPALARVAPEAIDQTLPIDQRLLIALPLMLRRAPAVIRAAPFQAALIQWVESAKAPTANEEAPASAHEARSAPSAMSAELSEAPKREHEAAPPTTTKLEERIAARNQRDPIAGRQPLTANCQLPTRVPSPEPAPCKTPNQPLVPATTPLTEAPLHHTAATSGGTGALARRSFSTGEAPVPPLDAPPEPLPEVAPDVSITSDFAGALFLINAGIALGFYSDFTTPRQRGIDLDIWQFVALLSRALTGEAIEGDPLNELLATLRSDEDSAWTPPSVLAAYPEAPDDPLARWIEAVTNHLRLRLGDDLAHTLVAQHGRITTTPAHIDAWFNLVKHPLGIRLAGLDRNPGWVPAAGRHVTFHFD
jgi:hypothetical protein